MASHQSTNTYTLLDQPSEDALHATRLLQVEERPFQRVTRNLLGKDSLLRWTPPTQLPSPPPDGDEAQASHDSDEEERKRQKFREDILLDFAALESSILRIQLTLSSNQRERERYAAEKAKILETAQAVRDNTFELRSQLSEAQRVLGLRKGYDELAAKLIDPAKLKPRADTQDDIEKLEKEIEDLEQESSDFEGVWAGRKEAFDKVVGEGQAMIKLIKGIKDEPEVEKEGERMDEGGEESGMKGERSRLGTPAPGEGGSTPMPTQVSREEGGETPLHPEGAADSGEGTASPMRGATNKFLDVEDATRVSSRNASPSLQVVEGGGMERVEGVDVEMGDQTTQLEAEVKTDEGMEVQDEQVKTPAEGMEGTEDRVGMGGESIGEEMDES